MIPRSLPLASHVVINVRCSISNYFYALASEASSDSEHVPHARGASIRCQPLNNDALVPTPASTGGEGRHTLGQGPVKSGLLLLPYALSFS
jgi:hypothetical protein